jgi:hypothetical protein
MECLDEDQPHWRERLRDELLPYVAFYGVGLLWLSVAGTIGTWDRGIGFAALALTTVLGAPVTFLVSLMMIWRMAMFGIDSGRVVPMVSAVSASLILVISALGSAFPALALGRNLGLVQQSLLGAF